MSSGIDAAGYSDRGLVVFDRLRQLGAYRLADEHERAYRSRRRTDA